MGKYMFRSTYTQAGLAGLLKEGGSRRREALTQTIEGMGGTYIPNPLFNRKDGS